MENTPNQSFDPRALLAEATALGAAVIAGVQPDQWNLTTPCDNYDVTALVGHIVFGRRRVVNVGRGNENFAQPPIVTNVPNNDWLAAYNDAVNEGANVWSNDALLPQTFVLPWATVPGFVLLGMYTNEVLTHSWDLAKATGQEPTFPEAAVRFAFDVMTQGLSAGGRTEEHQEALKHMPPALQNAPMPFGEAITPSENATPIEQLVAWQGRNPNWMAK